MALDESRLCITGIVGAPCRNTPFRVNGNMIMMMMITPVFVFTNFFGAAQGTFNNLPNPPFFSNMTHSLRYFETTPVPFSNYVAMPISKKKFILKLHQILISLKCSINKLSDNVKLVKILYRIKLINWMWKWERLLLPSYFFVLCFVSNHITSNKSSSRFPFVQIVFFVLYKITQLFIHNKSF